LGDVCDLACGARTKDACLGKTLITHPACDDVGPRILKKLRAKVQRMKPHSNIWFGNVENAAAVIIGCETVQYVSNIYKYYNTYSMLMQHSAE